MHLFSFGHLENVYFHCRLGSNIQYGIFFSWLRNANLVLDMSSKILHLYEISKLFCIKKRTSWNTFEVKWIIPAESITGSHLGCWFFLKKDFDLEDSCQLAENTMEMRKEAQAKANTWVYQLCPVDSFMSPWGIQVLGFEHSFQKARPQQTPC